MSTILKSLKKLEKEKEGPTIPVPAPALITGAGTHQAIHRSVRFVWLKGRILQWSIIGAACLLVFLIVLYTFNRPGPSKPLIAAAPQPSLQPVPKIKPQPASLPAEVSPIPIGAPSPGGQATEPKRMEKSAEQIGQLAPAAVSILPMPMAQRPGADPVTVSPPHLPNDGFEALGQKPAPSTMGSVPVQERRPQPKPVQPKAVATAKAKSMSGPAFFSEESLSGGLSPAPMSSGPPVTAMPGEPQASQASVDAPSVNPLPAQPQSTNQAKPSKTEAAAYAGAVRLTDGSLKVQAIVFAPSAEERMAVVNNTIVREGSAIQSYTIVGIGEEEVFVREGQGRLLKVPFGKP